MRDKASLGPQDRKEALRWLIYGIDLGCLKKNLATERSDAAVPPWSRLKLRSRYSASSKHQREWDCGGFTYLVQEHEVKRKGL